MSHTGIEPRHARTCPAASDSEATCRCRPSYRAWVYDRRAGKKIRKLFPTLAAARAWRSDAVGAVRRGQLRATAPVTIREAAVELIEGARNGTIRTRSGHTFKPSTIRSYDGALKSRILDEFGHVKLGDLTRRDLQDFADKLLGEGLDPSTIRNTLMPLRAIYRRALSRGDVAVNPTTGLELPAVEGRRERIAEPGEAGRLLAALPEGDRALWAMAMFAGLRRGELLGLRWEDVDLAENVIHVRRAWDIHDGPIEPKTRAGTRDVPIAGVLHDYLDQHKLSTGRDRGLVFGRTAELPFVPWSVDKRARDAWEKTELDGLTLHEGRHTFASLLIEAGVSPKKVSTYMGHASVGITLDRYAKLFEAHERDTLDKLDAFLERADTGSRLAQIE